MFKERIEYKNPKTIKEEMKKEIFFYDQNNNNKRENIPNWKTKRCDKFDEKDITNFDKNTGNNYRGSEGNTYKNFKPLNLAAKEREPPTTFNKNNA